MVVAVEGSRKSEGRIPDGVVVTSCGGGGLASSQQRGFRGVGMFVTCAQNDRHGLEQQLSSWTAPVEGEDMARLCCAEQITKRAGCW